MTKRKVSHCTIKRQLRDEGVDFQADWHELRSSKKDLVVTGAKRAQYRKSKTAPGSRGRMYFELLQRKKC